MARGKSKEKAAILERQIKALDMRKAGFSYRKIADKLGVSYVTAYNDVSLELGRMSELRDGKKDELRQLELERLDMLTAALDPMASVGNPVSVAASLKLMERRAKLLGLDSPIVLEIDTKQLETLIELLKAQHIKPSDVFAKMIEELALADSGGDRAE